MEATITYFEAVGRNNTDEVFRIVKKRAAELNIKTILVSSTSGETAAKAVDALKGLRIVAVGHSTGYREPNTQEFTEENRRKVESTGGGVLTATHGFGGVNQAIRARSNNNMLLPNDIISTTLRLFGSGLKVVVEIAITAADAGLVRTDEDVIAIAGTGRGADSAYVFRPVNSNSIFDLRIKEILCKPYNPAPAPRPATATPGQAPAGAPAHH